MKTTDGSRTHLTRLASDHLPIVAAIRIGTSGKAAPSESAGKLNPSLR